MAPVPKISDSYYSKRSIEKDVAAETIREAEDAEEERQIQLKAKRGRMDMFCTTKVSQWLPATCFTHYY